MDLEGDNIAYFEVRITVLQGKINAKKTSEGTTFTCIWPVRFAAGSANCLKVYQFPESDRQMLQHIRPPLQRHDSFQ